LAVFAEGDSRTVYSQDRVPDDQREREKEREIKPTHNLQSIASNLINENIILNNLNKIGEETRKKHTLSNESFKLDIQRSNPPGNLLKNNSRNIFRDNNEDRRLIKEELEIDKG
jgi:hypothetical protein